MPSNTRTLIDQFVEDDQRARDRPLTPDVAFELFAADCVLRARNLSGEEVAQGRIGGGGDGGIDTVHVFLDQELLNADHAIFADDFKASAIRRGVELELVLAQAKRETSFTETAIDKAASSLGRLLDLEQDDDALARYYSRELIAQFGLFRRAWGLLGIRAPAIRVNFAYVTRGDVATAGRAVRAKLEDLTAALERDVFGSNARVELLGSDELWAIASAAPSYDLPLRFREYSTQDSSYVGFVSLRDYFNFICDESGEMRSHLFDWNVRDFQGNNPVNREIKRSLAPEVTDDFWWLNNGVTILCSQAHIAGRRFTLTDVQIVNGMQTSHSLYTAISDRNGPDDSDDRRSILVRVLETEDEDVRDRVIRATNSQTRVPDTSLHATEPLHRQIESYFSGSGWYYDRRKNFYRNAGKPSERIVSIGLLGQATMAIALGRPDAARARPTTLLNSDEEYARIFSTEVPLAVYLWLAQLQRGVDRQLAREAEAFVVSNLRFHVSAYIATQFYGDRIRSPKQLAALASTPPQVTDELVWRALSPIQSLWDNESEELEWPYDRVSKSQTFADKVIELALGDTAVDDDAGAPSGRGLLT